MRLPRLRIQTLMIIIAVVGMCIASYTESVRWHRLRADYQRLAKNHGMKAAFNRRFLTLAKQRLANSRLGFSGASQLIAYKLRRRDYWAKVIENEERAISGFQKRADYHAGLARKYTEAASHPWRSVSPDPPEPEDPSLLEVKPPMPPPLSIE